ncbi:sialin-like [Macrosteles quadrilineatus]|uniref:sialin-like n=1 Tax=Macrosteles quadrilineatus TaxID=74068 RepID=UPI0023E109FC|nr:sialin-like [Macrosteles quadrilineatus]
MGYESEIDSDAPPPIQGTSHSSERLSADPDLRLPLSTETDWFSKRYLIAFLAFFGFANIYALRVNLSVAIVVMTSNYTVETPDGPKVIPAEFDWDRQTQGTILSSFFYGYILTQVLGGWLACQYGGVRLFGMGVLTTAALTLLTPLAAKMHVYLLILVRILEGMFEGVTYPAMLGVWARWAPPCERSRLVMITLSGSYFGTVGAMAVSGAIAQHLNWASIFYILGMIALFWCFLWCFLIHESPLTDPWVSEAEKRYILDSIGPSLKAKRLTVPWKGVLTSAPFAAIVVAHFCENWGFYTMLTELPTFMSDRFHMKVMSGNMLAALPYLVMGIVVQCSGFLADWLRSGGHLTTMQVRKMFTCAGFICQTIFLIAAAHSTSALATILSLTIAVGFGGFAWSGFSVNLLDIAPQFASVLMGISNTVATIPGLLSPLLTGYVTKDKMASEWKLVFYLSAAIYLVGAIVYGLLASGKVQPWASVTGERVAILDDHSSSEDLLSVNSRDYHTTTATATAQE